MNILDIVLVLLFIPGIIRGLSKGFLEQAASLAGVFVSVWVAFHLADKLIPFLAVHIPASEGILHLVAFLIILMVCIVLVLILTNLLSRIVEMATLSWLNKLLGLVFAVMLTAVVLGLLIIVFDSLNVRFSLTDSPLIKESLLYPLLRDCAAWVFPFLKDLFAAASTDAEAISAAAATL